MIPAEAITAHAREPIGRLAEILAVAMSADQSLPPDTSLWVSRLVGLGPGLTPSGDDFLGGMMIALGLLGRPALMSQFSAMVLRHNFNSKRLDLIYPILIGSTITINTFFIIYKGAKGLGLDKTPIGIAFGVAFGAGGIWIRTQPRAIRYDRPDPKIDLRRPSGRGVPHPGVLDRHWPTR